jgi:hypothetical protein
MKIMQQPNFAEITALLEVFRICLINSVLDKQQVIAWADKQIEQEAEPPYSIIELALSGSKNINDTISILHNLVRQDKLQVAGRAVLGYLYQRYIADTLSLQQVATTIYWLGLHCEFSQEEHHLMHSIDREYDLAADGYGSIAEAEKQIIQFTALYRAFNLENTQQWQEINTTIPKAVQALYQNSRFR